MLTQVTGSRSAQTGRIDGFISVTHPPGDKSRRNLQRDHVTGNMAQGGGAEPDPAPLIRPQKRWERRRPEKLRLLLFHFLSLH